MSETETKNVELTIRQVVQAELLRLLPEDVPKRTLHDHERPILQAIAARLVADGYSIQAAAVVIGMRDTTIRSWAQRDPEYKAKLEAATERPRARLMGVLWEKIESKRPGTPGVGQAINVVANVVMPEIRERKIEANVTTALPPGHARERILDAVNRGKPDDEI